MRILSLIAAAVLLTGLASPSGAEELIGRYTAFIGRDDLRNSKGQRLTEPWQILRQDRANLHRYGIRQPGDESDPFFASAENRAAMERMIRNGRIERAARKAIVAGGSMVEVEIWGTGSRGDRVVVTVTQ